MPISAHHALAPVLADEFKKAMRRFGATVTVISSGQDGAFSGMTATAVCSVSVDPPRVLIIVSKDSRSHNIVLRTGAYVVNVLGAEQEALAIHFASRPSEPFRRVLHSVGITGCPIVAGCEASMECVVDDTIDMGTHTIFVGRVVAGAVRGHMPLLHHDGRFCTLLGPAPAAPAAEMQRR